MASESVSVVHVYDIQSYVVTPLALAGTPQSLKNLLQLQGPTPVESPTFLTSTSNTDTISIGSNAPSFPLVAGASISPKYVDLAQVWIKLTTGTANQTLYIITGGY